MRFTLLLASSVLAASLALGACSSGGGSQAIPSGSSVSTMGHHAGMQLVAMGGGHGAYTCAYPPFIQCAEISFDTPYYEEWCISSTGSCSTLSPGTWGWLNGDAVKLKKGQPTSKSYKKIVGSYNPNPGNPTDLTIAEKKHVKSSKGKLKYAFELEACNSSSDCASGYIGLSTE